MAGFTGRLRLYSCRPQCATRSLWRKSHVRRKNGPGNRACDRARRPRHGQSSTVPNILGSNVDSTNQITLSGSSFGTIEPTVTLDGTSLAVNLFTDTQVVDVVPAGMPPGSYQLVVTNSQNHQAGASVATIGAVGP